MRRLVLGIAYGIGLGMFAQESLTGLERSAFSQLRTEPMFYGLEWTEGTALHPEGTGIRIVVDSLIRPEVFLLRDQKKKPLLYASEIATPVCADGDCRLMEIKFYWTLLGDYAGFDLYPGLPLTKYDHDEFLPEDYEKLHQLLLDENTALGRRTLDELVVKTKKPDKFGVDAVSGATIAAVKSAVVSGALYSCYIAWHIVHGKTKDEMKAHTLGLWDEGLARSMLYSKNGPYRQFAIQRLEDAGYQEHSERLAHLFREGVPLLRGMIAKSLPERFWKDPVWQEPYWDAFPKIDINSRSLLLGHLDTASRESVRLVSRHLSPMTKNQLKAYLEFLGTLETVDGAVAKNLDKALRNGENPNAYLIEWFLEEHGRYQIAGR